MALWEREDLGELSRYSDGLRAGRLEFDSQEGQDFSHLSEADLTHY
jgi:hypothetical protein